MPQVGPGHRLRLPGAGGTARSARRPRRGGGSQRGRAARGPKQRTAAAAGAGGVGGAKGTVMAGDEMLVGYLCWLVRKLHQQM